MSKAKITELLQSTGKMTKAEAVETTRHIVGLIQAELRKKGGFFTLPTIGTFYQSSIRGRVARNPRTGEAIKVKRRKTLRMRPSTTVKEWLK